MLGIAMLSVTVSVFTLSQGNIAEAQAVANSGTENFCNHGPYGYNVFVSSSTYPKKETVVFCLQDDTRTPLFIGSQQNPWKIVNAKGKVVYQPVSIAPTTQPQSSWTYFASWDQKNNKGKQVKPGVYTVVFDYPNSPSASFTISK